MLVHALPFAISLTFVPIAILSLTVGGWWAFAGILYAFLVIPVFDRMIGISKASLDPLTDERQLCSTG